MTLDDLIPRHVTEAVASLGLHKIAGEMVGVDELTLGHALASLGQKAYIRRKQAAAIVDGILSYAALTGEKIAGNELLEEMLSHAGVPAAAGAGIGYLAHNSAHGNDQSSALPAMGVGALLAGFISAAHDLAKATEGPLGHQIVEALQQTR